VYEVSVSDTIGIAHPGQVRRVLSALTGTIPPDQLALHFHDTRGTALANVLASLDFDIRTFDAAAGGLGGCPYAPGATGNLATEDLLYLLHGLGHETGVSIDAVRTASTGMEAHVGHPVASRYVRATASRRSP
jgi:isopropylmalate/homocitrate/citramalate synthase